MGACLTIATTLLTAYFLTAGCVVRGGEGGAAAELRSNDGEEAVEEEGNGGRIAMLL